MRITSAQNPAIKYVRSLHRAAARREGGVFLIEGVRLVRDALATGMQPQLALYEPEALAGSPAGRALIAELPRRAGEAHEVSPDVMERATGTETPPGVLAVLAVPDPPPLADMVVAPFGLVLDRVADPGNAGTMIRTAAAAGVSYVAATPGSVDLWAPKVVRGGMGGHFRLPIYTGIALETLVAALPATTFVATAVRGGVDLYAFTWPARAALIIGSEAHGLTPEAEAKVEARVHIPMRAGVESLNAAIAAAIVMYSALGPRLSHGG